MTSVNRLFSVVHPSSRSATSARPPLVVLHGVLASASTYTSLIRRDDFAPGSDKVAIDLPGHGRSVHDATRLTYPRMAADVVNAISQFPRVDIMGHSMGGKVAMAIALTRPELVRRLVVVDIAVR